MLTYSFYLCVFVRLSMKVASLRCDILLCTHFSQTPSHQDNVTQMLSHKATVTQTTERVLAVWNCPCRRGYSSLCFTVFFVLISNYIEVSGYGAFPSVSCCSFRIILWCTQQLTIVTVDWLFVSDAAVSESSCDSHSNSPLSLLIDWLFQMLQSQNHLVMHTATQHCHRCAFFNTKWDTFDDFFTRTSSCIRPQLY